MRVYYQLKEIPTAQSTFSPITPTSTHYQLPKSKRPLALFQASSTPRRHRLWHGTYKTTLSRTQVDGNKGRKIAEKLRGLEGAWRTQSDREAWLTPARNGISPSAPSGAGNHFAELQIIEEAHTSTLPGLSPQQTLHADDVVLLVHSGSRGYGGDILKRYTADNRTSIHESDAVATDYLSEHARACAWAIKNRDLIALRFRVCLEPGNEAWDLGINDRNAGAADTDTVIAARQHVKGWDSAQASPSFPNKTNTPLLTSSDRNILRFNAINSMSISNARSMLLPVSYSESAPRHYRTRPHQPSSPHNNNAIPATTTAPNPTRFAAAPPVYGSWVAVGPVLVAEVDAVALPACSVKLAQVSLVVLEVWTTTLLLPKKDSEPDRVLR
ncbi:MAG: hypothetical protein FRX48_05139 [Lasallia pustulata]|uniref:3'-phosphate/5'-hydroxy nucleic acid ligase n=1 Tax=Lasallia pustulata TaxID=136370 RepID=A0A5M8PMS4_9LECA|nr:MAG: hypothetical protein FRX48_05139 [Lasallia pustulata]